MSFFLIALLGTLIIMVYIQTIEKYDSIREERKAYILLNNIHELFIADPDSFYKSVIDVDDTISGIGIHYYDEHLRAVRPQERIVYRVFMYINYDADNELYSLYISEVMKHEKTLIKDVSLGKMRHNDG